MNHYNLKLRADKLRRTVEQANLELAFSEQQLALMAKAAIKEQEIDDSVVLAAEKAAQSNSVYLMTRRDEELHAAMQALANRSAEEKDPLKAKELDSRLMKWNAVRIQLQGRKQELIKRAEQKAKDAAARAERKREREQRERATYEMHQARSGAMQKAREAQERLRNELQS